MRVEIEYLNRVSDGVWKGEIHSLGDWSTTATQGEIKAFAMLAEALTGQTVIVTQGRDTVYDGLARVF